VNVSSDHLDQDTLSSIVDDQLTQQERARAEAHLSACATCQAQVEEFRSVAALLRALPEVDPPRDFSLGLRLVLDPPNVVRLRRWYTATRVAAGALAAVFVFLAAGTLYVDSRPAPVAVIAAARPQGVAQAPAPASGSAGLSAPTTVAARSAAAPAAAPARPPQADDQVAAATSVNPLPTPIPTLLPTPVLVPVTAPVVVTSDPGAPWRTGAALTGLLAVLALFAALVVRHRLTQT